MCELKAFLSAFIFTEYLALITCPANMCGAPPANSRDSAKYQPLNYCPPRSQLAVACNPVCLLTSMPMYVSITAFSPSQHLPSLLLACGVITADYLNLTYTEIVQ